MSGSNQFMFLPPLTPPSGRNAMAASILAEARRERQATQPMRVNRQSGGKATTFTTKELINKLPPKPPLQPTAKGRAIMQQKFADENGRLLSQSALDAAPLGPQDIGQGILSCINRGLVPKTFDLGPAIAGPPGAPGLVSVAPAPLHKHVDQFKRQEILTADMGFGSVMNVRLDATAIAAMNPNPPPPQPAVAPQPAPAPAPEPAPATDAAATKQREDTRTYAELLDMYSLHEFIIRKGATLRSTPEFVSYQRSYAPQWGAINIVVQHLERLLSTYGVPIAYIDGRKVAALASVDLGTPSKEELLNCIANRSDVEPHVASVAQQFRQGPSGHHAAATKIQSVMRMYLQRKRYKHLVRATLVAIMIQRLWAIHRGHMKTRRTLAVQRDALFSKWRQTQAQFVQDWPRVANSRRVILHVPSIPCTREQALSTPYFDQLQRSQLPRLCDLTDDKVEIVMISPIKIENEALQYYYSMLQANGVRSPESRVVVLVPEVIARLPEGLRLPLAKAVLCSSRLLRVLSSLLRGKVSYMVPGLMGSDEQSLAARLNVPILAPEARVAANFFTKSGCKAVFETADAVMPVGAAGIRSVDDLYVALAKLCAEFTEHPRWLIRIDNEFGSRGHAFIDVRKIKVIDELHKHPDDLEHEDPTSVATKVLEELQKPDAAAKRVKIVDTHVYPEWSDYCAAIAKYGCCVDAVPADVLGGVSTNLLIEPDGTAKLLSVQQHIQAPLYTLAGVLHPQTLVPFEALREASMSIATSAYRKRILGYITVDFIAFRRADNGALRLWAVDLELRLTNNALAHSLAMLASGATYDQASGQAVVRRAAATGSTSQQTADSSPLHYAYSGVLCHSYIGALWHGVFFNMCRQRNLVFDVQTKTGVVFHLLDVLLCCCLGALCIAPTAAQCSSLLLDMVEFLHQQVTSAIAKNQTLSAGSSPAQLANDERGSNLHHVLVAARNRAQKVAVDRRRLQQSGAASTSTTRR